MSAHTIPSVEKAIDVLLLLASSPELSHVRLLAQHLKISQSTCYRILQTLEKRNWVHLLADGGFELSSGLMPVAKVLFRNMDMEKQLQPILDQFVKLSGVSGKISIRQGNDALTLICATANKPMSLSSQPGLSFSLAYGSSGAAFLSALSEKEVKDILDQATPAVWAYQNRSDVQARIQQCREQVFCEDCGGYQPHVCTISVPFCNAKGQVVAAITALGMSNELTKEVSPRIITLLLESKKEAEAVLENI